MLYMYNCITLLYSRSEHNIVSQLYFYLKKKWQLQLHPCNLAMQFFSGKTVSWKLGRHPKYLLYVYIAKLYLYLCNFI